MEGDKTMKKMRKLLAVVMIVAMMIPVTAFAAEPSKQAKNLAECSVYAKSVVYNGAEQVATVNAVVDKKVVTLTAGKDYTGTIKATNAGVTVVEITGIGDYTGSAYVAFDVLQADVANAVVTVKELTYNTKDQTADVAVSVAGKKLGADDCTVAGNTNKNAGKYTVTVTGKGNYTGVITANSVINKADQKIGGAAKYTVKASKVKKAAQKVTIKTTVKEKAKLTYKSSSKNITVSKSGVVTVKKGTKKGTYTVTVTAAKTANYNKATKTVKIVVK